MSWEDQIMQMEAAHYAKWREWNQRRSEREEMIQEQQMREQQRQEQGRTRRVEEEQPRPPTARRRRTPSDGGRLGAQEKGVRFLRQAVRSDDRLMLQEALREKDAAEKDPYVHEGFFYVDQGSQSIEFSFFNFRVMSATRRETDGAAVYPVALLTNRSEMKRKSATCVRTWDEWKAFEWLTKGYCHYRYKEVLKSKLGRVKEWLPNHRQARRKAIEEFLRETTKDSRLLNTNLAHAFMYTDRPLAQILETMLVSRDTHLVDSAKDKTLLSILKSDDRRDFGDHDERTLSLLRRVEADGFLDSNVEVPEEPTGDETSVGLASGSSLGSVDVLRASGMDSLFDEVGVEAAADETLRTGYEQLEREMTEPPWMLEIEGGGGRRAGGWRRPERKPSCEKQFVVDYEAARELYTPCESEPWTLVDFLRAFLVGPVPVAGGEIPLVELSSEQVHQRQVERSFYDLGHQLEYRRMRGTDECVLARVGQPRPGTCPDGDDCKVRQAEIRRQEIEEVEENLRKMRRRLRRSGSDFRIQYRSDKVKIPKRAPTTPSVACTAPGKTDDGALGAVGGGGGLRDIFNGGRSFTDRKTSSACVAVDSQALPDLIETWQEDQHYPLPSEEEDEDEGISMGARRKRKQKKANVATDVTVHREEEEKEPEKK